MKDYRLLNPKSPIPTRGFTSPFISSYLDLDMLW